MNIGINGSSVVATGSVNRIIDEARRAEADGFQSFWLAEHITGGLDAITVLAMIGRETSGLELGTAIVPTFPRHPVALAGHVLTANQVLKRPLTLGLGVSHESMLNDLGLTRSRPIRHMSEYLSVVLPLLHDGLADYQGELYTARAKAFSPPATHSSVLIAALGPQMLRIAGTMVDGTILSWVGPRTIREHIKPQLDSAAVAANRPMPRIVATVAVRVTDDREASRRSVAARIADYEKLPSYRAMMAREGVSEVIDLCAIGGENEVRDMLDEYAEAGVTDLAALELRADSASAERTRALLVDMQDNPL